MAIVHTGKPSDATNVNSWITPRSSRIPNTTLKQLAPLHGESRQEDETYIALTPRVGLLVDDSKKHRQDDSTLLL